MIKKIKKQNGYVLVSGLILLLIITLIALAGTQNSIQHEKLAGDLQDKQVALENAETALRVAENYIYANVSSTSPFAGDCTGGLCLVNNTTPVWQSISWDTDTTHTLTLTGSDIIPKTTNQPKYIIELLDQVPAPPGESSKITTTTVGANAYRITAVGYGNKPNSKAMVQSVFVKR